MDRLGEWSYRGYLPHFNAKSIYQLVTFRLADALPEEAIRKLAEMAIDAPASRKTLEKYLDAGYGSALLRKHENAEVMRDTLLHFHRTKYVLHAWVVMPNHVHVLLDPSPRFTVGQIVRSWKGFSAYKIGKAELAYGRKNLRVWQPDYFDRYIRDEAHYRAACSYIAENPVKAGLVTSASQWKWSSAYAE